MKSINQYSQQKQAAMVKELLHKLKKESKSKKQQQLLLMFTESSIQARNVIKKQLKRWGEWGQELDSELNKICDKTFSNILFF